MKFHLILALPLLLLAGCGQSSPTDQGRERPFSDGWRFCRLLDTDDAEATPITQTVTNAKAATDPSAIPPLAAADYDDASWLSVDLPHDFSLMPLPGDDTDDQVGPFSKASPGGKHTGHVMGGTGWYRRTFVVSPADAGKRFTLVFDGAYMETDVYVNGQKAGDNRYGYSPFAFDITSLLRPAGQDNVVAVRVDNLGANSRWYSGSGLYRDVTLMVTEPVHVDLWGIYVVTPRVSSSSAQVDVQVSISNDGAAGTSAQVYIALTDAQGQTVATSPTHEVNLPAGSSTTVAQTFTLTDPVLWSIDSPTLYQAVAIVEQDGCTVDTYTQRFGIRSLEFSAGEGMRINGEPVLMRGGCLHHDNGLLGAAAIRAAEYHRVKLMKDNGYNAIRCSHNPPSRHFLDACDELGLVVIDEFYDMWDCFKNRQDYSRFFAERWESDLTRMMLRDRNHPSIVIWSIGNEIPKRSIDEGVHTAQMLCDKVRSLDNTRPIAEAIPHFLMQLHGGWQASGPFFDVLDVGGYNYMEGEYESDHRQYPQRIMMGTESYPLHAYDNWTAVERLPYVIGDFVWTALDYIGEVSVGKAEYVLHRKTTDNHQDASSRLRGIDPAVLFDAMNANARRAASTWPHYISGCGDLDIIGQKKPQGYYRDVIWGLRALDMEVHEPMPAGLEEQMSAWGWPQEFHSWNWPGHEGEALQVRVFTRYPQVRLELNGEVVGQKALTEADRYIATFSVPYQPGRLTAIALDADGQQVDDFCLPTTGPAVRLRLTADQSELRPDRSDLAYVLVEAVDSEGRLVTTDNITVDFAIDGNGTLAATGNADTADMRSLNNTHVTLHRGQAQAIIRPFAHQGGITLQISAPGLEPCAIELAVR